MGIHKGTKLKDKAHNKKLSIRVDEDTMEKLDWLANEQKSDRSKIIRKGIEIQYEREN